MFCYDRGLRITPLDLAVDICRRQPRGFISHAHSDHMAAHELAIGTPLTAALYRRRYGDKLVRELPFEQPWQWDEFSLSTHPAGHIAGSAMLHVAASDQSLLYTGDFRLRESMTAETPRCPHADILVMECTFGQPHYKFPPRELASEQLIDIVSQTLRRQEVPVIHAYVTGKAQEVTAILAHAGLPVKVHPLVAEVNAITAAHGIKIGNYGVATSLAEGFVYIAPPRSQKAMPLLGPVAKRTIAVTGWAIDPTWRTRQRYDYAVVLSDHADYDELLECVDRVAPRQVYCTHGPMSFVADLRERGIDAHPLNPRDRVLAT